MPTRTIPIPVSQINRPGRSEKAGKVTTGYTRGAARGLRSLAAGGGKQEGPGGLRKGIAKGITARTGNTGPGVMKRATKQAHAVRAARRGAFRPA